MLNATSLPTSQALRSPFSRASLESLVATATVLASVQPFVDLESSTCVAHELFARAHHESFGTRIWSLAQRAETMGLAVELSRWLRQNGLRKTASRVEPRRLFVRTHPKEVARPNHLLESLTKARERYPGLELVVEIHPQAELTPATFSKLRRGLKRLDVGVAFDEFGEGRSRLLELATAPPDFVKFSAEMVRDLDRQERSREKIVRPILQFIHSVGAVSIATGVETAGEMEACREIGFEWAQGPLVGRPWVAA